MTITPIPGEPTRFYAAGNSYQCPTCNQIVDTRSGLWDDQCQKPKCTGTLEPRLHLVDIASLGGNGECSCEHFQYKLRKKAAAGDVARCTHLKAAREFALDMMIRLHAKREGEQ